MGDDLSDNETSEKRQIREASRLFYDEAIAKDLVLIRAITNKFT